MFKLLADYRTNKIYVSEILETAKTLGIHDKYKIVFRCLQRLQEDIGDDEAIDFETFVKELTQRIVIFIKKNNKFTLHFCIFLFCCENYKKKLEIPLKHLYLLF